ncbi:hypothetical protein LINPERHAP1_LOCUS10717 [Linum perenne]
MWCSYFLSKYPERYSVFYLPYIYIAMWFIATMKILLLLLILLLPLSSLADPAFRSTDSNKGSPSSVSSSPTEFHLLQQGGRVLKERDEIGNHLNLERRIEMEESTDYPGTGANSHHDPKTPGRP